MPNCFTLISKTNGESPRFGDLDDTICRHLGIEPHPVHYACGWYDVIGWAIAVNGLKLGSPELRAHVASMPSQFEGRLLKILDYLEENYTSDAWREIGNTRGKL